jgi:hypothetical protein
VVTGAVPRWARDQGYRGPSNARQVFSADHALVAILPSRPMAPGSGNGTDELWVGIRPPVPTDQKAQVVMRPNGTGAKQLVSAAAPLGRFQISTPKAGCYTYAWTVNGHTRSVDLEWTSWPVLTFQQPPPWVQKNVRETLSDAVDARLQHMDAEYAWVRTTRKAVERVIDKTVTTRQVGPGVTAEEGGLAPWSDPNLSPDATVYVAQVRQLVKPTGADLGDKSDAGDGVRLVMVTFDRPVRQEYTAKDGTKQSDLIYGETHVQDTVTFLDLAQLGTPHRAWTGPTTK